MTTTGSLISLDDVHRARERIGDRLHRTPLLSSATLSKQVDKSVAAVGDTLTYTLSYANTGSQTAHQVVISDALTGGLTFIPGSNGAQVNGGTVSFALS